MTLISVVIPTFNCEAKIEKSIASVLAQSADLRECIVVDGASTDATLAMVAKFGDSVRCISEPDAGVYEAMNKGVRLARGTYIYFLGAGDNVRPGAFANMSAFLPADELNFVYGDVCMMDGNTSHHGRFDKQRLRLANICHQAIFYHRTIFDLLGDFDARYPLLADYAYNLKCFGDNRIKTAYINQIVAEYEGGGISFTRPDNAFAHDFPRLVRESLGVKLYLSLLAGKYNLLPMNYQRLRRHSNIESLKSMIRKFSKEKSKLKDLHDKYQS